MTATFKDRFETLLAALDAFFASKNPRERPLLFVIPVVLFGFLSYEYIIPLTEQTNAKVSRELRVIESEIATYKDLLAAQKSESSRLSKLEEENHQLRATIAQAKDLSLYTEARFQELKFIRFDAANWSDFLHQLVTYATRKGIAMSAFSNSRLAGPEEAGKFTKVLSVDFNTTGEFYNMMAFIKAIESDPSVTDIEKLNLQSTKNRIEGDFTVTLWGIIE